MPRYLGTKLINAVPMTRLGYNTLRGWAMPEDENDDDGYLVEYLDGGEANHPDFKGYISWSPKQVIERAYTRTSGLSFGMAIEALRVGLRVARAGWNGKGQFVYLVPAASYPVQTSAAKSFFGEEALVPYNAYFALKGVEGVVSTWVPSITDCLALDWEVLE